MNTRLKKRVGQQNDRQNDRLNDRQNYQQNSLFNRVTTFCLCTTIVLAMVACSNGGSIGGSSGANGANDGSNVNADGSPIRQTQYVNVTTDSMTNEQYEWDASQDAMPDTWVATDGLGRNISTNIKVGDPNKKKFVGMFYWTWHSGHAKNAHALNNTQILKNYPGSQQEALEKSKEWGDYNEAHHWGEPLFGFYDTEDEWVLRKHAEMLANAGIDYVAFDNTNGVMTWEEGYLKLLKVWGEARKNGVRTPQITFMLPFGGGHDAKFQLYDLYQKVYKNGEYKDLLFNWDGKPLILCSEDVLDPNTLIENKNDIDEQELRDFFTFRYCHPSYGPTELGSNIMQWMSVTPQNISRDSEGNAELVPVSVAQNWDAEVGLTAMNGRNVFGRTHTVSKGYDRQPHAQRYGANFAEQFTNAKNIDPEIIFITGWNEWVAGRFAAWQNVQNAFPDQFNEAYSRDLEPENGDLADHYYNQLIDFVRQFKGARAIPTASGEQTIDINANESPDQWTNVAPNFLSYAGNTFDRDADGYIGTHYTDKSGRNDIVSTKVARDSENIYFMVETNEELTPYTDENWMRLFIDVNNWEYVNEGVNPYLATKNLKNWESYEYVINRVSPSADKAVLERSKGGWNWEKAGQVEYTAVGKRLQIKVPKAMLGLSKVEDKDLVINFKWADNNLADGKGNILDFYTTGDVAPNARFKYQYRTRSEAEVKAEADAKAEEEARLAGRQ